MHRKNHKTDLHETVPGLFGEESDDQEREPEDFAIPDPSLYNRKVLPWEYKRGSYGSVKKPRQTPGVTGRRWDHIFD